MSTNILHTSFIDYLHTPAFTLVPTVAPPDKVRLSHYVWIETVLHCTTALVLEYIFPLIIGSTWNISQINLSSHIHSSPKFGHSPVSQLWNCQEWNTMELYQNPLCSISLALWETCCISKADKEQHAAFGLSNKLLLTAYEQRHWCWIWGVCEPYSWWGYDHILGQRYKSIHLHPCRKVLPIIQGSFLSTDLGI